MEGRRKESNKGREIKKRKRRKEQTRGTFIEGRGTQKWREEREKGT